MDCYRLFVFLVVAIGCVVSETCTKPEVSFTSYTTQDATVLTHLAFIAEFTLKCGNGVKGIPLHAEVKGRSLPGKGFRLTPKMASLGQPNFPGSV